MILLISLQLVLISLLIFFVLYKEDGLKIYKPIVPISILYFLEFVIPSIYIISNPSNFYRYRYSPEMLSRGLLFIFLVYVFFLIGYYFFKIDNNYKNYMTSVISRLPNINNYSISIKNLPLAVFILMILGWGARLYFLKLGVYIHEDKDLGSTSIPGFELIRTYIYIPSVFPIIAMSLLFIEWLKSRKKKLASSTVLLNLSLVAMLFEIIYAFPTGSKEKILSPLVIILILFSLQSKIPWKTFAFIGLFSTFIVFPVTNIYRAIYSGRIINDLIESFSIFFKMFFSFDLSGIIFIFDYIFGSRLNYSIIVSLVVDNTPLMTNFKLGYTYLLFFISFIPRFLWRSKPAIAGYGNQFALDYGIITPVNEVNIAISWVGEMFINFGWFGLLVAFIYGVLFHFIYSYFFKYGKLSTLGAIFYSFSLYYMVRGEMFATQFSGLLKFYLILTIVLFPFIKRLKIKNL